MHNITDNGYSDVQRQFFTDIYQIKDQKDLSLLPRDQLLERAIHLLKGICCYQRLDLAIEYYRSYRSPITLTKDPDLEKLQKDAPIINAALTLIQEKKYSEAYPLLLTLEASNYGLVLENLAFLYAHGLSVEKDVPKAIKLYEKSIALNNNPQSLTALGVIYEEGRFVEINIPKAVELYEKASSFDDSLALTRLGTLYALGEDGLEKDTTKAIQLLEKAVSLNEVLAIGSLAILYHREYQQGRRTEKNTPKKIVELCERSIHVGNYSVINELAYIFEKGAEGVEKDVPRAIQLYEQGVALNSPQAINNLADIYERGAEGVKKDIPRAIFLYKKAINAGSIYAIANLALIYTQGDPMYRVIDEGITLLKQAILIGDERMRKLCIPALKKIQLATSSSELKPADIASKHSAEESNSIDNQNMPTSLIP